MHTAHFHSHRPTYQPTQRHTHRGTEMQSHLHTKTSHLIPLPPPHSCSSERNLSAHVFYNGCNYAWIEVSNNEEKNIALTVNSLAWLHQSVSLSCLRSEAWLNTVYTKREFSQHFGSHQTKTHFDSLQTQHTFSHFHISSSAQCTWQGCSMWNMMQ